MELCLVDNWDNPYRNQIQKLIFIELNYFFVAIRIIRKKNYFYVKIHLVFPIFGMNSNILYLNKNGTRHSKVVVVLVTVRIVLKSNLGFDGLK